MKSNQSLKLLDYKQLTQKISDLHSRIKKKTGYSFRLEISKLDSETIVLHQFVDNVKIRSLCRYVCEPTSFLEIELKHLLIDYLKLMSSFE